MGKSFLTLFLLLLWVLASPVLAADHGFYISGHVGGVQPDESRIRDADGEYNLDFDLGQVYGGAIGYDFGEDFGELGQGRVELEFSRRSNDLKEAEFSDSGWVDATGEVTVSSLMLNTMAEYRDGPWLPHVGFGLGYAIVSFDQAAIFGTPLADDEDGVFAWQLGAGLGLELSRMLVLDLDYRYFATLDPEFEMAGGGKFESEYTSHNVMLGLRMRFF